MPRAVPRSLAGKRGVKKAIPGPKKKAMEIPVRSLKATSISNVGASPESPAKRDEAPSRVAVIPAGSWNEPMPMRKKVPSSPNEVMLRRSSEAMAGWAGATASQLRL
jgi:hypothetical protein